MSSENLINNLNFNYLKVFESVYRLGQMTEAAAELHLTQSGVSQHIRALEQQLGHKLFDRVHRRILPTKKAQHLYTMIMPGMKSLKKALQDISGMQPTVSGVIRIGMPIEYGDAVLAPQLAKIGQIYPDIRYEISLDYASKFNEMILEDRLDFAFVDSFQLDRRIVQEPMAEEALLLCASPKYLKEKGPIKWNKSFFESLHYVAYQQSEPVIRQWLSHHLKRKNLELTVRAWVMDVQAIAKLIHSGLGVGVLPDHLVQKMNAHRKELVVMESGRKPVKNAISLAYLRGRELSHASLVVIDELKKRINT